MSDDKMLLSVKEAQEVLGIGRNSIYKLLNEKDFPSIKIHNKFYIDKNGLQKWIESKYLNK